MLKPEDIVRADDLAFLRDATLFRVIAAAFEKKANAAAEDAKHAALFRAIRRSA